MLKNVKENQKVPKNKPTIFKNKKQSAAVVYKSLWAAPFAIRMFEMKLNKEITIGDLNTMVPLHFGNQ